MLKQILIGASIVSIPVICAAETWVVNVDGTGDAPTLQAAIDSCSSGDSVQIDLGTYYITEETELTIVDVADITIFGPSGSNSTILDAQHAPRGGVFAVEGSYGFIVKGISFLNNMFIDLKYSSAGITFDSCQFHNNDTAGLITEVCDNVTVSNSIFSNNRIGVLCIAANGNIHIVNNTFINHGKLDELGAIHLDSVGPFYIWNNIIYNNYYGVVSLSNQIYYRCNDSFDNILNYNTPYTPDPTGSNGNITLDPQFCAESPEVSGNYFLQSDSPCAPGNHPTGYDCGLIGVVGIGCGDVGTERKNWGGIKVLKRTSIKSR